MVDELTERIRREISSEFGISRCDVQLVKYTMTLTFDVSAPVNHTLEEFGSEPLATPDQAALAKKIKDYAARTGQDPLDVLDDLKKEKDRQQMSIMDAAAAEVNAGALDGDGFTVRAKVHPSKRGEGKEGEARSPAASTAARIVTPGRSLSGSRAARRGRRDSNQCSIRND